GLPLYHLGWSVPVSFGTGLMAGIAVAAIIGVLALRTTGVAFMIVTMMFAQVFYLGTLYFTTWTRGEEGLVLSQAMRSVEFAGWSVNLSDASTRYMLALALFAVVLLA